MSKKGTLIKQKTEAELLHELEDMDLISNCDDKTVDNQTDAFIVIHHSKMDANYDIMAKVLHWEPVDVRTRLKELGYEMPDGA